MAQLPNMYGRAHEMLGLLGLIRYSFVVFVVVCKKAEEGGEVRQANTCIIVDLKKITVCAAPGTCTCTRPGLACAMPLLLSLSTRHAALVMCLLKCFMNS